MNRRGFFALWLMASMALSSCGAPFETDQTNTLHRGLTGDPESLDVHLFSSVQATTVLRDIREGLVTLSPNGSITGGVAETWEISPDGKKILFHLRKDARWSNGRDVTAMDFVASLRRLVDPATGSPYASFIESIENAREIVEGTLVPQELGVHARSKHVLEIILVRKNPYFIQLLLHPSTFPIYADFVLSEQRSGLPEIDLNLTNGAYKIVERRINSLIRLERDAEYWRNDETFIDKVLYHVVDQNVEFPRFRAGELDVTNNVTKEAFNYYKQHQDSMLKISNLLGIYYYGYNLSKAPLQNDFDLRAALSLAINRQVIVEDILGRGEIPAYSWVPPGTANYSAIKERDFDLDDEAREQLALEYFRRSKFINEEDQQIELRYNSGGGHERIALAVQSMWRDVLGVEAELVAEEFKVFLSNVRQMSQTEVYRLSWTADFNDAYAFLSLFESGNPSNLTGYTNSAFDDLLKEAQDQDDIKDREVTLQSAERMIIEGYPGIPLYFYVSKHLVSERVIGWTENVLDIHYSRHLRLREGTGQR